jgi:predicted enzyme related to lactoylglutathione lyase
MNGNSILHFDISGPNEQSLHRFYRELLGWTVDRQGPGYALVETPGGLRGSLIDAEASQVTLGVGVDDLDEALTRAGKLVARS